MPSLLSTLDLNPQFVRALELMEASGVGKGGGLWTSMERGGGLTGGGGAGGRGQRGPHVFITGRAGTGKSTLLSYFMGRTRKRAAVLAPTGVAALNVGGATIHSFFGFRPDVTVERVKKASWGKTREVLRELETIVIDEVSMVRADLLDCVDKSLQVNRGNREPFGGVQMVFIGDLYQLPPVVTSREAEAFRQAYKSPYFFDSRVWKGIRVEMVELEKMYRQTDGRFIGILNGIRNNTVTAGQLQELNSRVQPLPKGHIMLTPRNDRAGEINMRELGKLDGVLFRSVGKLTGGFEAKQLPTEMELAVKEGAQVMMVNNDPSGRWVNGSVGKVTGIEHIGGRGEEHGKDDNDGKKLVSDLKGGVGGEVWEVMLKADETSGNEVALTVELEHGKVDVLPHTWKVFRYVYNKQAKMLETEAAGSFTQYPLRLAWAVTIHKAQGKTFDKVIVDLDRAFSPGQAYVALSRCTSMDGLVLARPVEKKQVFVDWRVVNFLTGFRYARAEQELSLEEKVERIGKAIGKGARLKIVYLAGDDTKSDRVIVPKRVGEMDYLGKTYVGVEGYCTLRKEDRVFRVDRILEMTEA